MQNVDAKDLHKQLSDGTEIALLDVRDEGVFGDSHILTASCMPAPLTEIRVRDLVPNTQARLVLCDDGKDDDALARRVGEKLEANGYSQVAVLRGGLKAWEDAGLVVFSGVNVPSKAFGEFVEINQDTPHIAAQDLAQRQRANDDLVILDSRPHTEYHNMSIPGGVDCPGAELVYRAHVAAPNPATTVVVNCAGRTRSIIGAQSLINAGLPNPVMALENGTMGWHLAGLDVARGMTDSVQTPVGDELTAAKERASQVAREFGVRTIDETELNNLRAQTTRSFYLFDVRSPEEYDEAHRVGARSAPGGQLVQATDEYIAVRNSIVVLTDDTGVRANMTASWLRQLGWLDVYVLPGIEGETASGKEDPTLLAFDPWQTVSAQELKAVLDSGESCEVMDLSTSVEYLRGHIAGSWWSSRSKLTTDLAFRPAPGLLVLTSSDSLLAHYCAPEVARLQPDAQVRVLADGTQAWAAAGLPLDSGAGAEGPPENATDVFYKPYEYSDAAMERMQAYLDWEVALVDKVVRDDILDFAKFREACRTPG